MPEFLNKPLIDGITPMHAIGIAVALIILIWLVPKLFKKKRVTEIYETVRCLECGWAGQVSKYHRTCRKCNSTTLEKIG